MKSVTLRRAATKNLTYLGRNQGFFAPTVAPKKLDLLSSRGAGDEAISTIGRRLLHSVNSVRNDRSHVSF
jgi:hypothetical protein